jgi:hypothetical protein
VTPELQQEVREVRGRRVEFEFDPEVGTWHFHVRNPGIVGGGQKNLEEAVVAAGEAIDFAMEEPAVVATLSGPVPEPFGEWPDELEGAVMAPPCPEPVWDALPGGPDAPRDGERWQYHGIYLNAQGRKLHSFRHRCHPNYDGDRVDALVEEVADGARLVALSRIGANDFAQEDDVTETRLTVVPGDEVRVRYEGADVWCHVDSEPGSGVLALTPVDPGDSDLRICSDTAPLEVRRPPEVAVEVEYGPKGLRLASREESWGPVRIALELHRERISGWSPYTHLLTLRSNPLVDVRGKHWLVGPRTAVYEVVQPYMRQSVIYDGKATRYVRLPVDDADTQAVVSAGVVVLAEDPPTTDDMMTVEDAYRIMIVAGQTVDPHRPGFLSDYQLAHAEAERRSEE